MLMKLLNCMRSTPDCYPCRACLHTVADILLCLKGCADFTHEGLTPFFVLSNNQARSSWGWGHACRGQPCMLYCHHSSPQNMCHPPKQAHLGGCTPVMPGMLQLACYRYWAYHWWRHTATVIAQPRLNGLIGHSPSLAYCFDNCKAPCVAQYALLLG